MVGLFPRASADGRYAHSGLVRTSSRLVHVFLPDEYSDATQHDMRREEKRLEKMTREDKT